MAHERHDPGQYRQTCPPAAVGIAPGDYQRLAPGFSPDEQGHTDRQRGGYGPGNPGSLRLARRLPGRHGRLFQDLEPHGQLLLAAVDQYRRMDAWKTAPVAFESCWDMRKWKEAGWISVASSSTGLGCHASYMNNKSAPVPEGTRGEVERFLRRLGCRLVVRSVDHTATAHAGGELDVTIAWENVGVAPPYPRLPCGPATQEREGKRGQADRSGHRSLD